MVTNTARSPLIVIVGETASGKSAFAMKLAQKFNGEIICGDSRTVYKGMDIGTAKPSLEDQQKVPHHMLNIATPVTPVTVADFKKRATEVIDDIASRNKLSIMVGGTGLYIDAVVFDFEFRRPANPKIREALNQLSVAELHTQLNAKGISIPENAQNSRHLIRAIETQGSVPGRKPVRPNTLVLGLLVGREELKQRVVDRVDKMLSIGLEAEARRLSEEFGWDPEPMKSIGYQEFHRYFESTQSFTETRAAIIHNTLLYAKRQRTWFNRNNSIHWFNKQREAVDLVTTFLNK